MQTLIILNDPPYGTERSYNGLRLALALAKLEGSELRCFLMADAVWSARGGQTTPAGYYNVERMLRGLALLTELTRLRLRPTRRVHAVSAEA